MSKFKYAKLVRDKIWGWHEECGHTVEGRTLTGDDLRRALCKKLHEEADEVDAALSREELIEEIADVQQILNDLCAAENIDPDELEKVRVQKQTKKGGFLDGKYIETVAMPTEDEWVSYCRKDPEKYPEIRE